MNIDLGTDPDDVPTELRRSVDRFWPAFLEVRTGDEQGRYAVMAISTSSLEESGEDEQQQWLYFQPQGARKFAELLTRLADSVENPS